MLRICIWLTWAALLGFLVAAPAAAQTWTDDFDRSGPVSRPWEKADGVAIVEGSGFRGSGAVTGDAGDRYGGMWRRSASGKSVELTARIRVSSTTEQSGAVVALSPTTQVAADQYHHVGVTNYDLGVRLIQRSDNNGNYAALQVTYGHPFCGQSLLNYRRGRRDLDTWYDVKLQAWPSDDGTYLASAWYRPSGTHDWTAAVDKWPGNRHVVAYEGFDPAYVAVAVSQGAFIDHVSVKPADPPSPVSLSQPEPVNDYRFTVLSYSWSTPDTKYLHDNVAEMEKTPFDGVAVQVGHPRLPDGSVWSNTDRDNLGWKVFSKHQLYDRRFTRDLIDPAIDDLETTAFHRFRSNYVVMVSHLTDVRTMDWFDDVWWANIAENAKLIATVAREGGCEGILFDPEMYGCAIWGWPKLREDPLYNGRSYDEVTTKVRQRGREFVSAINEAYPDVRILLLHAWDTVMRRAARDREGLNRKDTLHEIDYGLLPAFLDGLLEASDDRTVVIDGVETTYWVNALPDFAAKARGVREDGIKLSDVPDLFRRKVRVGFAIYLDRDQRWDPSSPQRNYWTPGRLALVLGNALAAGDGLVWIYSERPTWLLDLEDKRIPADIPQPAGVKFVPDAYRQALDDGRRRAEALRRQHGHAAEPH